MTNMSEYDQRQLRLMETSLISFEKNKIGLSSLIGNLEFLFSALEEIDNKWEERFLNEITALETVNAIEIMREADEDEVDISATEENKIISKCISSLKKIIKSKII